MVYKLDQKSSANLAKKSIKYERSLGVLGRESRFGSTRIGIGNVTIRTGKSTIHQRNP